MCSSHDILLHRVDDGLEEGGQGILPALHPPERADTFPDPLLSLRIHPPVRMVLSGRGLPPGCTLESRVEI